MKLFVGNLGDEGLITNEDLRPIFEKFGSVTECECIKNFAFVHYEDEAAAEAAVRELHGTTIKGRTIKVERSESKGPRKPTQKLFVGNIKEGTSSKELRDVFEQVCPVVEADVIKNFGFVHIDAAAGRDLVDKVIAELNGYELNGSPIRVTVSTSSVRQRPGMSGGDQCYNGLRFRCGRSGHWSKECPGDDTYGYDASRPGPMRGAYGAARYAGAASAPYGAYAASRSAVDPYPPQQPPSYLRDARGGYGDAAGSYYGGSAYGSSYARDRSSEPAYVNPMYDRGAAAATGYARDVSAPIRGSDPYGSRDPYAAGGYSAGAYGAAAAAYGANGYNTSSAYSAGAPSLDPASGRLSSSSYVSGGHMPPHGYGSSSSRDAWPGGSSGRYPMY